MKSNSKGRLSSWSVEICFTSVRRSVLIVKYTLPSPLAARLTSSINANESTEAQQLMMVTFCSSCGEIAGDFFQIATFCAHVTQALPRINLPRCS